MKKLFFVLLSIAVLAGCKVTDGVPINFGAPTFPAQLCAEYDPSTSFLLTKASQMNIPLNELYYGLLDVTQIGMALHGLEREDVKTFMEDVGKWYDENYPVSYTMLLDYMTDKESARAIAGILSRRIGAFRSITIIGTYDDCLLRAGWSNAMDELYLR